MKDRGGNPILIKIEPGQEKKKSKRKLILENIRRKE
jgi:hypothetical protein